MSDNLADLLQSILSKIRRCWWCGQHLCEECNECMNDNCPVVKKCKCDDSID